MRDSKLLPDHADERFKRVFKEFLHIYVQNVTVNFNSLHQKFKLFN